MPNFTIHDHDFRERLLELAAAPPIDICPFYGCIIEDGEYMDVEGHGLQISPAYCTEPDCEAYQLGGYKVDPEKQVYLNGWVRNRKPDDGDQYPIPKYVMEDEDWFARLAHMTDCEEEQKRILNSPTFQDALEKPSTKGWMDD